jgi:hypothetical protein
MELMNKYKFVASVGILLLVIAALLTRSTRVVAADKASKGGNRTALEAAAKEWSPNRHARDYHSVGALTPTNAPPTVYAVSFSTSQSVEDVWNFFAEQCGIDKKYSETNLFILSGQNQRGSFVLVERLYESRLCESIFALRSKNQTVTATVRPGNGDRTSAGSIVVVLQ